MSSFADDIERLVKLHGVADDGVKPLIEKAIEMLIEKETIDRPQFEAFLKEHLSDWEPVA